MNRNKEKLFDLIRKEEVVLWIGAGFSLNAGIPSGKQLVDTIYHSFTETELKLVEDNLSLADISETYINLRGDKNSLIELIAKLFICNPYDIPQEHKLLRKIPHIKTIITTNYDNLLENTYGKECVKVTEDKDIPLIKNNLTSIIKIHGDFSNYNKMILTRSDYNNLYNGRLNSPIWELVKERAATSSVAFLGYGFEDPNVNAIFDRFSEIFENNRRELFLISPNISPIKEVELERKKISYIKSTGIEFLKDLTQNINENITFDLQQKTTSVDTGIIYLKNRNLSPRGKVNKKGGFEIDFIEPISGAALYEVKLSINNENVAKKISNQNLDKIIIRREFISKFEYTVNGIRQLDSDINNINSIAIIPISEHTIFNIYFPDVDFELFDIPLEITRKNGNAKYVVTLKSGKIIIYIKHNQIRNKTEFILNFEHNRTYINPNEEIKYYKLLLYLNKKKKFYIRFNTKVNYPNFNYKLEAGSEVVIKDAEMHIDYFSKLRKIEQFYNISFDLINCITKSDIHNVDMTIKNIQGNIIENDEPKAIKISINQKIFDKIKIEERAKALERNVFDLIDNENLVDLNLHGQNINLGYQRITINNPVYLNKEDFINGISNDIIMSCEADSYFVRYDMITV